VDVDVSTLPDFPSSIGVDVTCDVTLDTGTYAVTAIADGTAGEFMWMTDVDAGCLPGTGFHHYAGYWQTWTGDYDNIIDIYATENVSTCASEIKTYNCSVPMEYYYPAGAYNLKIDSQDPYGTRNQTSVVEITFGELAAFSQDRTYVTFSGDFVGQANKSIEAPIVVTNTGNKNVTVASILAYDLTGNTVPGYKLGAQYFRAGGTLETSSQLIHGQTVNASLSLPAGPGENASFYLWLSAPSTLYPQGYHSDPSWSMSLN
jgi:hypothetical protein